MRLGFHGAELNEVAGGIDAREPFVLTVWLPMCFWQLGTGDTGILGDARWLAGAGAGRGQATAVLTTLNSSRLNFG